MLLPAPSFSRIPPTIAPAFSTLFDFRQTIERRYKPNGVYDGNAMALSKVVSVAMVEHPEGVKAAR
jgi:hypothetical protein